MSYSLRTLIGSATLAAGLWAITTASAAGGPDLPKDSYKKAADADLAFLKTRLADLVKEEAALEPGKKVRPGYITPAIGTALLLSVYGDALGDATLKTDAIKVAEAIKKNDFKGASALAQKLTVKPGTPGKVGTLPKPFTDEVMLEVVMSPFRGGGVGGLNMNNDLAAMTKKENAMKIDPAAVELLGVRSAVIISYGFNHPNDDASMKPATKKQWEKLSTDSIDLSKQIVTEAAKGKGADEKALKTLLSKLNARCNDCHEPFRK